MTSYDGDPRPPGCTHFEKELMTAMNNYADSTDAPVFDAPGIVRRTRRRRAAGIAAVATALILAGGGTALASMGGSTTHSTARPASTKETVNHDPATMLLRFDGGGTLPIDFWGWTLKEAKAYLDKTQTHLGTVTQRPVTGCKPGTVVAIDPHTPATVDTGDTINLVLCAR
ncbi:hypothetical protein [Streptomyces sp. NPDC048277]|uniref:PASTA domain-containing protein n=1 Tax=Streptomyces sp. NPDC048277 TaxID=3155027 RepID=UPI0033C4B5CC